MNTGYQLYEAKCKGKTNEELTLEFGISERTIRNLARQYAEENGLQWPVAINQNLRLVKESPLTVSHQIQEYARQDSAAWREFLRNFSEPYMRILILNDIHFPNQDNYALDIVYAVADELQPHIIGDGSDVFDHETVGRWPVSLDKKLIDAWATTTKPVYQNFRQTLKQICNHVGIFYGGNHDYRIVNFIKENAPQLSEMVELDFINSIRENSLWTGYDTDAVSVGNLLLTHGRAAGKYPAQKLWESAGYNFQVSVGGHVHRKSVYEHTALDKDKKGRFIYKTSAAYTTGCLCKLPAYDQRTLGQNWSQGFGVAVVDMQTDEVYFEHIDINSESHTAIWGGRIYRA